MKSSQLFTIIIHYCMVMCKQEYFFAIFQQSTDKLADKRCFCQTCRLPFFLRNLINQQRSRRCAEFTVFPKNSHFAEHRLHKPHIN